MQISISLKSIESAFNYRWITGKSPEQNQNDIISFLRNRLDVHRQERIKTAEIAFEILLKCLAYGGQTFYDLFLNMEQCCLMERKQYMSTIVNINEKEKKSVSNETLYNLSKFVNEILQKVVDNVTKFHSYWTTKNRTDLIGIVSETTLQENEDLFSSIFEEHTMIERLVQSIKREDLLFLQFSDKGLVGKRNQLVLLIGKHREELKTTSDKSADVTSKTIRSFGGPVLDKSIVGKVSESLKQYFDSKSPFEFSTDNELNIKYSCTKRRQAPPLLMDYSRTLRKRTSSNEIIETSLSCANPKRKRLHRTIKEKKGNNTN
jgi:hypothetical protein